MNRFRSSRGFTLVELLVALFAMALLAVLSWRGLDGMARAQAQTEARADQVLTLQVGLAQWSADLDALMQLPQTTALDWNGRVLRLTRRGIMPADGMLVVAWTRRVVDGTGTWLRWQSPQLFTRAQYDQAWQQADIWSQNPGVEQKKGEVAIVPLDEWQLFYFRADAWTNPLSSDALNATAGSASAPPVVPPNPNAANLPDGVRLVLVLPPGQAISGKLTRDWIRPNFGGNKS
jgi:general secretion pathway protein J